MNNFNAGAKAQTVQLLPMGDSGLLIRFSDRLDDAANRAAIGFAQQLVAAGLTGVEEVVPSLVSVFLRYNPMQVAYAELSGAVRLVLSSSQTDELAPAKHIDLEVSFGGDDGPDLHMVAKLCGISESEFITAHNQSELRVLATGFAPGFVYCGLHPDNLIVPRRGSLHSSVPAGSVLFAAGQTSIMATSGPTGWHVIGRTRFRNFDPMRDPPTELAAGDWINFVAAP